MAKDLFKRYVWLVDTIRSHPHSTLADIQRRWYDSSLNDDGSELSARTFLNHRRQIGLLLGIYIECDKRTNTYYIELDDSIFQSHLTRTLINQFSLGVTLSEAGGLKGRISFEDIPSGEQHLETLIKMMRENKVIELTYQSYWMKDSSTWVIEPYALKFSQRRWYLVARRQDCDELRTYALDRIISINPTGETFKMPKDFDVDEYFSDTFGIIRLDDVAPEVIRIKVMNNQAAFFRSLPLHPSQREVIIKSDYSEFEYHLRPTYDFYQALLSHNANVEVLSPKHVRKEMKEYIEKMYEIY